MQIYGIFVSVAKDGKQSAPFAILLVEKLIGLVEAHLVPVRFRIDVNS